MEALTISAANLDVIEKNMSSVAHELSGVINNVNSVNNQVNKVEEQVETLNNGIKNLVKEIRETTTITNARQSIMYNDKQIEKKYGYYDQVRRTTESLLDSIENSSVSAKTLVRLKQELLMNNPNYWLSNALTTLISWILDDREETEKELNNALKKDSEKTSIFFSLINLKLGRKSTSINWLINYLDKLDPTNLNREFVTVLDLVSNGVYGTEGRRIIADRINKWMALLNTDTINDEEINRWISFIESNKEDINKFQYLDRFSMDVEVLKNNLAISTSYKNVLNYFKNVTHQNTKNKTIDNIINNLIYEYEKKEQVFQSDNLRNRLIIECNGDREKADKLYQKEKMIYEDRINLISLLSNIVIYKEEYKVSNHTQAFALSLVKGNILKAYEKINSNLVKTPVNIKIDNFVTSVNENTTKQKNHEDIVNYLNKKYPIDDKTLTSILFAINIVGVVGIFITLKSIFSMIIGIGLLIADIVLVYKIFKDRDTVNKSKNNEGKALSSTMERTMAEVVDYKNTIKENEVNFNNLKAFLNSIDNNSYIKSNNERNIKIDE
ncbi:MAG: hypothetical protein IJF92_01720 [Bacilli bacterium]|nr:hypothetical protein [Bacilli bacterium]